MSGELIRDTSNKNMQVFAPAKVVTVISGTPWVPEKDDRVFMPTVDVNLVITTASESAQTSVPIPAHLPVGINKGFTYTFDAAITIMVM